MADTGRHSQDRLSPTTSRQSARQQQQQCQEDEQASSIDTRLVHLRHHQHTLGKHESAETAGDGPASTPRASRAVGEGLAQGLRHAGNNSSGPSSDEAQNWFDSSNRDPRITMGGSAPTDVEPPFLQRETDSSADDDRVDAAAAMQDGPYSMIPPAPETSFLPPSLVRPTPSSVTEDYRSVIDDLTIENKRLKEELKRYRQNATRDVMEKEKLFEVKLHGLPRRKKQELEATLRNFAASLGTTSASSESKSTSRHKREKSAPSKHKSSAGIHSLVGPSSKHASSSSTRSRPVDSAYASMSVGANSSGAALARPSFGGPQVRTSEQKVESYLQDIPEGLHPNYGLRALSDKDKKKLIVRRLEQLFTGKIGGRYARRNRAMPPPADGTTTTDDKALESGSGTVSVAPAAVAATDPYPISVASPIVLGNLMPTSEPAREALIQSQQNGQKRYSDNLSLSNSNSNGDETGNGNGSKSVSRSTGNWSGNGNGNGGSNGNGKSPTDNSMPEQRPTRPLDLDPYRVQIPAENMDYIRHLGLIPPHIGHTDESLAIDMSPDADGWVYLNLLSNLAQLHIFHVAPDFIRKAIVEKSTKFQLSPDGQKIRWRGGTDGTKFSSDGSSGENGNQSQSTDEGDGSDKSGRRKKAKISGDGSASALSSSKKLSRSGLRASKSSSSFHYKPLFARQISSPMSSAEDLDSQSSGDIDGNNPAITARDSNSNESRSDQNLSESSPRHRRRTSDGVLVYYTGAPFCTDLAGDSGGDTSPATFATSSGQTQESVVGSGTGSAQSLAPLSRTTSGAHIRLRPLTDYPTLSKKELLAIGLGNDDADSALSLESSTDAISVDGLLLLDYTGTESVSEETEETEESDESILEASGIGRVFPEDHFSIVVTTKRLVRVFGRSRSSHDDETTVLINDDGVDEDNENAKEAFSMGPLMKRLAALKEQSAPISGAVPRQTQTNASGVSINYVSAKMRHREPAPLPPPVAFYRPLSPSSESGYDEDSTSSMDEDDEDESMLASSSEEMISRRANPHQSDIGPSPASQASGLSGDSSDVDAETMEVDKKGDK